MKADRSKITKISNLLTKGIGQMSAIYGIPWEEERKADYNGLNRTIESLVRLGMDRLDATRIIVWTD